MLLDCQSFCCFPVCWYYMPELVTQPEVLLFLRYGPQSFLLVKHRYLFGKFINRKCYWIFPFLTILFWKLSAKVIFQSAPPATLKAVWAWIGAVNMLPVFYIKNTSCPYRMRTEEQESQKKNIIFEGCFLQFFWEVKHQILLRGNSCSTHAWDFICHKHFKE